MSIADYISPIVGYRVWTWNTTGLKSLCGERWHPGQSLAARCRASAVVGPIVGRSEAADDHDAPQANCTCGIHAVKTLHHFRSAGYERYGIYGEVYLWGTVVEHEFGYRARFAYRNSTTMPGCKKCAIGNRGTLSVQRFSLKNQVPPLRSGEIRAELRILPYTVPLLPL